MDDLNTRPLEGKRVLIAEDDALLAFHMAEELSSAGAVIVGSVGTIEEAMEALESDPQVDVAILDIMLRSQSIFPLADELAQRGIAYLFATGVDGEALPAKYAEVPQCPKPFASGDLISCVQSCGRPA